MRTNFIAVELFSFWSTMEGKEVLVVYMPSQNVKANLDAKSVDLKTVNCVKICLLRSIGEVILFCGCLDSNVVLLISMLLRKELAYKIREDKEFGEKYLSEFL